MSKDVFLLLPPVWGTSFVANSAQMTLPQELASDFRPSEVIVKGRLPKYAERRSFSYWAKFCWSPLLSCWRVPVLGSYASTQKMGCPSKVYKRGQLTWFSLAMKAKKEKLRRSGNLMYGIPLSLIARNHSACSEPPWQAEASQSFGYESLEDTP